MYCPECQVPYRDGFDRCADCDVALVAGEPPKPLEPAEIEWESVCTPIDMNQVVFIKSLLTSEGIPFVVQGGGLNSLYAPARVVTMTVLVPKDRADNARELLKDLK